MTSSRLHLDKHHLMSRRRAKAALAAGWQPEALHCCDGSLAVLRDSATLRQLHQRCREARASDAAWRRSEPAPACPMRSPTEREVHRLRAQHYSTPEQSGGFAQMMEVAEMTQPEVRAAMATAGPRVPKFHIEYFATRGVPPAADTDACQAVLLDAYGSACSWRLAYMDPNSSLDEMGALTRTHGRTRATRQPRTRRPSRDTATVLTKPGSVPGNEATFRSAAMKGPLGTTTQAPRSWRPL